MFKNYFKTAFRNLIRNRTFSILNIAGLAVGIASASLIFLWLEYNVTYNSAIPDLNNIYQVENNQVYGKDMVTFAATSIRVKDALLQEFPGVVNVSRFNDITATVALNNKLLGQQGAYADSAFLKMFGLQVIEGNATNALNDISQIAISQKLSNTYFDNGDAMGKILLVDNHPYKVSAVYKDIPKEVTFYGKDFLLPFQVFYNQNKEQGIEAWGNNWTNTWVQLNPNTNVIAFNSRLRKLIHQKDAQVNNESLWLYPLKRLKLYGQFTNGKEDPSQGLIQYIKMFSLVALVILLIACINFMNLSSARSEKRAKEIGMRKVLGSTRKDLITRLLSESVVVAYIAVLLAVTIVASVLPAFSRLIDVPLHLNLFAASHLLFLVVVGAVCGLVAGSYPALYLSSFNPARALKNQISGIAGSAGAVRKGLVVIQFTISVVIIIAVIVIYQQIQFTKKRDLGFNKDNVLYVPLTPTLKKSIASLKQDILNTNKISSVSLGSFSPMRMYNNGGGWNWEGKSPDQDVLVTHVSSDADYLKTFDISLKAGRPFSQDPNADSMHIIINESFANIMGKAGHIGGQIWGNDPAHPMTIIGIAKNFVYNNMSETNPAPLAFYNNPSNANYIFIKIKSADDLPGIISKLKTIFGKTDITQTFDYHFVDKDFEQAFQYQQFIGSLATIFGFLAIFISCLGLFGLSAFMAERRKKEVGVRKVIGASISSITALLSKDFLKLVVFSCVIAFPLAYWMMNNWLQNYPYRVNISWYMFAIAAVLALLIAFITVSFQAIRAARMNPVKSLRAE